LVKKRATYFLNVPLCLDLTTASAARDVEKSIGLSEHDIKISNVGW